MKIDEIDFTTVVNGLTKLYNLSCHKIAEIENIIKVKEEINSIRVKEINRLNKQIDYLLGFLMEKDKDKKEWNKYQEFLKTLSAP